MVIVFVKEYNLGFQILETSHEFYSSKTASDYDDSGVSQIRDSGARGNQIGVQNAGFLKLAAKLHQLPRIKATTKNKFGAAIYMTHNQGIFAS